MCCCVCNLLCKIISFVLSLLFIVAIILIILWATKVIFQGDSDSSEATKNLLGQAKYGFTSS